MALYCKNTPMDIILEATDWAIKVLILIVDQISKVKIRKVKISVTRAA